ncbi:MAG: T9SS type A sorting domain-containing protein [Ignavibacteriales bacterium]|nr:T9SS type A sorting domain-containing protein [Ignavibacteriales bacterium]
MLHKNKLMLLLLLVIQSVIPGQSFTDSVVSKIKIDYPELSVEQVRDGIIKVTYPDGTERLENIAPYTDRKIPEGIGYTVIDIPNTDTIPFFWKYRFWQQLYLTNFEYKSIKSGDVNRNGLQELYGFQYIDDTFYPTVVFEKNEADYFEIIYNYPESNYIVENVYDINRDGNTEVAIISDNFSEHKLRFYSKPKKDSLAVDLLFTFRSFGSTDQSFLGDFDGDSLTDMVYSQGEIWIVEYNPQKVNFDTVYNLTYQWPNYTNLLGYGIGDFDQDRKTELVAGDLFGKILVIENSDDNTYDTTWSGSVNTFNAYFHTQTNDIDKNGKPEFWVMGHTSLGITTITIFEASGDNEYQAVGIVDLYGVVSFNAGNLQSIDIDEDGTEEIVITVFGYVIILKFTGSQNNHNYSVYYLKKINEEFFFQNAVMYPLGISHKNELLISFFKYNPRTDYTEIYIASDDTLTSVGADKIQTSSMYLVNYPNPFNISTVIRFGVVESVEVTIKIYNSLGEEVNTLLDKFLSPGSYELNWEGKNKQSKYLPSGLYFIILNSGGSISAIKTILLK